MAVTWGNEVISGKMLIFIGRKLSVGEDREDYPSSKTIKCIYSLKIGLSIFPKLLNHSVEDV